MLTEKYISTYCRSSNVRYNLRYYVINFRGECLLLCVTLYDNRLTFHSRIKLFLVYDDFKNNLKTPSQLHQLSLYGAELQWMWKLEIWANLYCNHRICLEEQRNTMKNLNESRRSSGEIRTKHLPNKKQNC